MSASHLFPADWLDDAAELEKARREELAETVLYVSERRYKRQSAVDADLFAYGLGTLGGTGVLYPDGFYRVVIPGGKRPDVLERHLTRIAPGLEFFPVFPGLDDNDSEANE